MSAAAPPPVFLALLGPTASGKTALSLALARRLGGEIISMDSRQVYRGMDIGTAKATPAERAGVPHHGLDLVDPDERYSAGRFARDARVWVAGIRARGHVPMVVGGTGFFLRALTDPIFSEPAMDPGKREALRRYLAGQPREQLERWVRVLDPARAPVAVGGGAHRMGRTLEVALLTGRTLSHWHRTAGPDGEGVRGMVVRLDLPREEMDRRIDARSRAMVESGLIDEVRGLLERGYDARCPGMTGTGYREVVRHLEGHSTREQAIDEIAAATRRYARRQVTWLRHQLPVDTVSVDAMMPVDRQVERVAGAWRERAGAATNMDEVGG
jgi:tRNA dimethylallyltransferase